MKSIVILLLVVGASCSTDKAQKVSSQDKRDLIEGRLNFSEKIISGENQEYQVKFSKAEDQKSLKLEIYKKLLVRQEWDDKYSAGKGSVLEHEVRESSQLSPLDEDIIISSNKKSAQLSSKEDGVYIVDPTKLGLSYANLDPNPKITLSLNSGTYDVTNEFSDFLQNERQLKQERASAGIIDRLEVLKDSCQQNKINACNTLRKESKGLSDDRYHRIALSKLCSLGAKNACDDFIKEFKLMSDCDLAMYLSEANKKYRGVHFERGVLYGGNYMVAFQKVAGGYMIAPDPRQISSNNDIFGNALLITKERLPENSSFRAVYTYEGEFNYKAVNGFDKTVPKLKLYTGEVPPPSGKPCM